MATIGFDGNTHKLSEEVAKIDNRFEDVIKNHLNRHSKMYLEI